MTHVRTFAKSIRENNDLAQYVFAKAEALANGDRDNPSGLTASQVYQFMCAYALTKKTEGETLPLCFGRLLINDVAMRTLHNAYTVLGLLGFKGEAIDESLAAYEGADTNGDGVVNEKDVRVSNPEADTEARKNFTKAATVKRQTLHVDPDSEEEQERLRKHKEFRKVVPFATV